MQIMIPLEELCDEEMRTNSNSTNKGKDGDPEDRCQHCSPSVPVSVQARSEQTNVVPALENRGMQNKCRQIQKKRREERRERRRGGQA